MLSCFTCFSMKSLMCFHSCCTYPVWSCSTRRAALSHWAWPGARPYLPISVTCVYVNWSCLVGNAGGFSAACPNTHTGQSQQVEARPDCVQTHGPGHRIDQHGHAFLPRWKRGTLLIREFTQGQASPSNCYPETNKSFQPKCRFTVYSHLPLCAPRPILPGATLH